MYLNGEGTTADEGKAFKLFEGLALEGDANAQCQMGWMYEMGKGEKLKDEWVIGRKASEWYWYLLLNPLVTLKYFWI